METAHKTTEEKKEYFDSPEVLDKKLTVLAELIKNSKNFVAFTGAGISTAAGIPDYRSGMNTVIPTGPGVWERKAQGLKASKEPLRKAMQSSLPTYTHMSLVALEQKSHLKYLISQNVDGLHRKSGFPATKLAEVHGNTNLEYCAKCTKDYLRDFRSRTAKKVHDHRTGRFCDDPKCKGELLDSIINFGENLPEKELNNGFEYCKKADLCLAMGSSLRVTPAADMPAETAKMGGKLVIVNLQATPLDSQAFMRINALVDDVMKKLMEKLAITVEKFTIKRRVAVTRVNFTQRTKDVEGILFTGLDMFNAPYTLFKGIDVMVNRPAVKTITLGKTLVLTQDDCEIKAGKAKVVLKFQGHYNEPNLPFDIQFDQLKLKEAKVFDMVFDPITSTWINFTPLN